MVIKNITIPPCKELLIDSSAFTLKVIKGVLDHLGQELLSHHVYTFQSGQYFFTSFDGCEVELDNVELSYVSDGNIESIFDLAVNISKKEDINTNKKMVYFVLGHGRSTFLQTISNLLIRMSKKILLMELDPHTGFLVFPGAIATTLLSNIISIEEGIQNEILTYFYGNDRIENKELFEIHKTCLFKKWKENDAFFVLWPNEEIVPGEEEINNYIKKETESDTNILGKKFDFIPYYIIIGDERLYHTLQSSKKTLISCYKYQKRVNKFNKKVFNYFHGQSNQLTPIITNKNIKIHSIGERYLPPMSALPIGHERKMNNLTIKTVAPELNSIVAISYAKDEKELIKSPVKGFILTKQIGNVQSYMCVQEKISDGMFLQGNLKYCEEEDQ